MFTVFCTVDDQLQVIDNLIDDMDLMKAERYYYIIVNVSLILYVRVYSHTCMSA